MTDEMTVQAQRPSALPYVLGGAALGGAAGVGASAANLGFKTQAYQTWEEAVADVNKDDSFVKSQIDKGGDNKANWEAIQTQAKAVKDAEKALSDFSLPEGFEGKAELEAAIDKEIALADAKAAKEKLFQAEFDKELKNLKEMDIKAESPFEFEGKKYNQEEFRTLLNSTKEEDKKLVERLVKDQKAYKDAVGKEGFAKTEADAVKAAEKALTEANEALAKKVGADKITDEIRKGFGDARKAVADAKKTANEKLTGDLLGKCKKANTWKTAAIGAAVLALAGLMIRPKGEEA